MVKHRASPLTRTVKSRNDTSFNLWCNFFFLKKGNEKLRPHDAEGILNSSFFFIFTRNLMSFFMKLLHDIFFYSFTSGLGNKLPT